VGSHLVLVQFTTIDSWPVPTRAVSVIALFIDGSTVSSQSVSGFMWRAANVA
jgi:hypothetical protein